MPADILQEDPRAVPGHHKASYTAQANKRALCTRLTSFIRLVDVLVADAMHSLALESVTFLFNFLRSLDLTILGSDAPLGARQSFGAADPRRHSVIDVNGCTVLLRRPTVQRNKLPGGFQPKGVEQNDGTDTTPLFQVELLLELDAIRISPDESVYRNSLQQLIVSFQNAVIGVETLLPDAVFVPFTQPIISGRQEPVSFSEPISLRVIFDEDKVLQDLSKDIDARVISAFSAVQAFTVTLNPFREMLVANAALDEAWLRTTDHTPEYFRESLHLYKQQFTDGNAITPSVEIGMMLVDCNHFKEILLPSPKRCWQLVQSLLPVRAAQKTKNVMKRMDDAVYSMEVVPANTLEHVKMLTFLGNIETLMQEIELEVRCVTELYDLIEQFEIESSPEDNAEFQTMKSAIIHVRDVVKKAVEELPKKVEQFCDELDKDISALGAAVLAVRTDAQAELIFSPHTEVDTAVSYLEGLNERMNSLQEKAAQYKAFQKQFKVEVTKFSALEETHVEVRAKKSMWESVRDWAKLTQTWDSMPFLQLDADDVSNQVQNHWKKIGGCEKIFREKLVLNCKKS